VTAGDPGEDHPPRPPLPLAVSAALFLGFVGLVILGLIMAIAFPRSGISGSGFAGGVCFTPILLLFGAVFWKSTFGRSREASEAASVLYFLAAGLTVIVGIGVLADALAGAGVTVALPALAVLVAVFVWLTLCGFLSMRWAADLEAYRRAHPPEPPPHARDRRDDE
jgi:hypothetical protein